jgi:hypothetical protein
MPPYPVARYEKETFDLPVELEMRAVWLGLVPDRPRRG